MRSLLVVALAAGLAACDDASEDGGAGGTQVDGGGVGGAGGAGGEGGSLELPATYTFVDGAGAETVSYTGQSFRHVLIAELTAWLGGLTAQIDGGTFVPAEGDVVAALGFWFDFDAEIGGSQAVGLTTDPPTKQRDYAAFGSTAKLAEKIAGNDPEGQHADWSTAFVGFTAPGVTTPESLVRHWFAEIEALAVARANGEPALGPDNTPIASVFVSPEGLDYKELLQKFLLGAIAFSQGADDYLDDDLPGKGLLSDNVARVEGKPYTALAHGWDEGFGYFGAAKDFGDYTDDELAAAGGRPERAKGYFDLDGDGAIDLGSEFNFGHATNAAKRDRGSNASTDFTRDAWEGFLAGRALIARAGELDAAELAQLKAHRDRAVGAWEAAIASTVVHYINDVLRDMAAAEYDFMGHAKHWSELKGFALSLQFNPRSPLSDADFAEFHRLVGQRPVRPGEAEATAYRQALLDARALVAAAYGFDAANVGDENGENGW
jgi:hypothetical protein